VPLRRPCRFIAKRISFGDGGGWRAINKLVDLLCEALKK